MKTLIRFKGGCGGEFLKSLLYDQSSNYDPDTNRHSYQTRLNTFLYHTVERWACDRYRIPFGTKWEDVQRNKVHNIVTDLLSEYPDDVICMHFVFKKNLDHARSFPGFKVVDLTPRPERFWIIQALQFHKAAFVKSYHPPMIKAENDPRYKQLARFYSSNGWYPIYWSWLLEEMQDADLYDFDGFIESHGSPTHWMNRVEHIRRNGSEIQINGDEFVIDNGGSMLERILAGLDVPYTPEMRSAMGEWASRNRRILDDLGGTSHLDEDMDPDDQVSLLKRMFAPICTDLLKG